MSQIDAKDKSPFSLRSLLNWAKLKENLKVYGRTGVVVYLGISFSVTSCLYFALERNVDVRKLLGIKDDPNKEPTWVESVLIGKGSNLALAMLCSKFFVPIKLPAALALTPYVHRWQERAMKAWADRAAARKSGL